MAVHLYQPCDIFPCREAVSRGTWPCVAAGWGRTSCTSDRIRTETASAVEHTPKQLLYMKKRDVAKKWDDKNHNPDPKLTIRI